MNIIVREIHLINTTPPHNKFYTLRAAEQNGEFLLIRESGRINSYTKQRIDKFTDLCGLIFEFAKLLRRRIRNGYRECV